MSQILLGTYLCFFFKNPFIVYLKSKFNWHTDFFFLFGCVPCGVLVPQPVIEPVPPALEAGSLNHWTTEEVSGILIFCVYKL